MATGFTGRVQGQQIASPADFDRVFTPG